MLGFRARVIAFFLTITYCSFAQESSPYSSIGLGELQSYEFALNRSMGSISTGYRHPLNINVANPASLTALKRTTLETGIYASYRQLLTQTENTTSHNATLSYLALGYPVTSWWGGSFGLIPFSRIGYDYRDSTTVPDLGAVYQQYTGEGGIYQFFIGNGFRFKKISAGFNVGYLFGTNTHMRIDSLPDGADFLNTRQTRTATVGDIIWNAGIQFSDSSKNDWITTVGVDIKTSRPVRITSREVWERFNYTNNFPNVKDTILNDTLTTFMQLPAEYRFGFTVGKAGRWQLGADFSYKDWSAFHYLGQTANIDNSWKVSAGGSFTPDRKSHNNYFKVINYRLGLFYDSGHLKIGDRQIPEYGMTFGVGLPLRRVFSRINLSFEVGQRGTVDNDLIRETFVKAWLGFTLNDKWFIKRKFD